MTQSERAFEQYWDRVGHCQRFRDKKDLAGLNRHAKLADFPKPADYAVSSKTIPLHYAEVKETEHPTRFPFSKIRPAQRSAALMEAKRGAGAYKFYIFSIAKGRWFIMTCENFLRLIELDKKSVTFEELQTWDR